MTASPGLKKFFTTILVIMPILNVYSSPVSAMGLGEFCALCVIPFFLICMKEEHLRWEPYWIFVIYFVAITIIVTLFLNTFDFYNMFFRLLREVFYICILLVLAPSLFDVDFGKQIYIFFATFASAYMAMQVILFYLFDFTLMGLIKGLDYGTYILDSNAYYLKVSLSGPRPCSIFLEPTHFATFVCPALIFVIFDKKKSLNLKFFSSIIFSICILISTSASGLAFVLIIWGFWLAHYILKEKHFIIGFFISTIAVAGAIIAYVVSVSLQQLIARFLMIDIHSGYSSANIRLFRGFAVFAELPRRFKLVGIGFGNISSFLTENNIVTSFDNSELSLEYMSGVGNILVCGGIIGLIIFSIVMFSYFKKSSGEMRCVLLFLFAMLASSDSFPSISFTLPMVFVLCERFPMSQENFISNTKGFHVDVAHHRA